MTGMTRLLHVFAQVNVAPVQENVVPATVAAVTAGLLATAGAVLAFTAAGRRARRTPGGGSW